MVLLRNFPAPTEGVHHVQPNTRVFFESEFLGKGTLYVSKSVLCWLSSNGEGFSLTYPSIFMHGISLDPNNFPDPCIFMMITDKIVLNEDQNELASAINAMSVSCNGDEEEEMEETYKLLFVPDDTDMLHAVFTAIKECSALNPGPKYENTDDEDGEAISPPFDIQFGNADFDPDDEEAEASEEEKNYEQFEDADS